MNEKRFSWGKVLDEVMLKATPPPTGPFYTPLYYQSRKDTRGRSHKGTREPKGVTCSSQRINYAQQKNHTSSIFRSDLLYSLASGTACSVIRRVPRCALCMILASRHGLLMVVRVLFNFTKSSLDTSIHGWPMKRAQLFSQCIDKILTTSCNFCILFANGWVIRENCFRNVPQRHM